ncbi:DoxX family protein [Anaeromyxobacter dehalogenans 2CP-1]|uniref:DoxX family protein n=1 Tax=Anaeromyxobacter dehalogenans (strain ATCC BAA-258 / DSM 21875 / 2CP-1) TaxID=455488 RepID=B8J5W1_ANAD2|nr:MauE/DoxX family redox-associated membrane protein [Anaeromyxobacter dehalogenans]ACL65058.1 DoxX family protein [Anaeromyxobacter dehalogenans 2CP-1]
MTGRAARWAIVYARLALAAAFLSAVGSRLGLWGHNDFDAFVRYTAEVNAFLPAALAPFLARAATVAETTLGLALLAGVRLRWVALASAGLLAVFGAAMGISFGPKSPLDYSVFSASAAALLLALAAPAPVPARGEARRAGTPGVEPAAGR